MTLRTALCAAILAGALSAPASAIAAPAPELPPPTYESVASEILIPMDDGVRLGATVALPSRDGQTALPGPFPVVVGMTPYGRNGLCGCYPPDFFATRGMAGAVVDVRGTGGSEGTLEENFFSPREARDSREVIEFLASRPYSNGKVGMAGGSYVGITQLLAAEEKPPHLAAIAPQVPISDLYRDGFAHGGIPNLLFDLQYIGVQGAPGSAGTNTDPMLLEESLAAKLGQSPPGTIAFDYLERPNDDAFYRDRSPIYRADRIDVPTLVIGGWRDGLLRGAPEMYGALAGRKGVETRLYIDPCTHKGCGAPLAPLTDPPGQEDVSALVFEFLSEHLAGAKAPDRAPVRYYMQPKSGFRDAEEWPPADAERVQLGLSAGGLGEGAEAGGAETGEYVTNPAAGFSAAFERFGTVAATPYVPTDQRLEGPQGLTFRTGELERPLELTGPIGLRLIAASTAPDTDWHAKLADVAPDGSEAPITDGALRASHRAIDPERSTPERPYHTHTDPQAIEPGRFYEYEVEIWPTAYRLEPGHRLQLRLTSTDLPTHLPGSAFFDRDHPAATRIDLNQPAVNTVRYADSRLNLFASGWDAGAAGPQGGDGSACPKSAKRRVRIRDGRRTRIVARISKRGRRIAGAPVRVRGPGFARRVRTDERGRAAVRVRAKRDGRATVSTRRCGATVRAKTVRRGGGRR